MRNMLIAITLLLLPALASANDYVRPGQFINKRTLVSFWSSACETCQNQIPILINFARYHPDLNVTLINITEKRGQYELPETHPSNFGVIAVDDGSTSIRAFGGSLTSLPFSAFVHDAGAVCESHAGTQGLSTFEDWAKKCSK